MGIKARPALFDFGNLNGVTIGWMPVIGTMSKTSSSFRLRTSSARTTGRSVRPLVAPWAASRVHRKGYSHTSPRLGAGSVIVYAVLQVSDQLVGLSVIEVIEAECAARVPPWVRLS